MRGKRKLLETAEKYCQARSITIVTWTCLILLDRDERGVNMKQCQRPVYGPEGLILTLMGRLEKHKARAYQRKREALGGLW